MKDKLIRGITQNKFVRFFGIDSTETLKYATKIHNLSITSTVAYGRLLNAAVMMGMDLKSENDLITLKIDCNGPIKGILITAKNNGDVKGYAKNPEVELPLNSETKSIDIKNALGTGQITIIKDLGLKHPYVGTVELLYGEIAEDITYYFAKSDQIPTSVGLGVLIDKNGEVKKSGGFIIQLMPGIPEETIVQIEKNLEKFPNLTDMMDMGYSIEELIINYILKRLDAKVTETKSIQYKCDCSKEKFRKGLKLLEKKELEVAIQNKEVLQTNCHFCNKTYDYKVDDIKEIIKELK
ncbi:MAG: Hsp33 family molecular chaperone HslO [Candidatus Cloacimonetes bacterium]|nr:Hsp33 family molecular chaperone HslO [Candidatus Cloacimonadota bacterium]